MTNDPPKATADELLTLLQTRIDSVFGFYFDTKRALPEMVTAIERLQQNLVEQYAGGGFPDSIAKLDNLQFTYGRGNPSDATAYAQHRVTQGDLKSRNRNGGINHTILINSVISFLYSIWNDEYRPKIAASLNIEVNDLSSDIFGDIRLLRNSIIHHNGVASSDIKKCKIISRFKEGDQIIFTIDEMNEMLFFVMSDIDRLFKQWIGKETSFGQKRGPGGDILQPV